MPINRSAVGAIAGYVEDQRKRREEAYKSDQEFQQRMQAAGIASGRLEPIIQGGQITGVKPTTPFGLAREWTAAGTSIADIESGRASPGTPVLGPGQTYSQRISGGTLTSRGPVAPREVDPLVQLQREIAAQNALQSIEQRNALAPTLAMSEREKAFPRPAWGGVAGPGYVENDPNWFQSLTGVQKRPQAPAVAYTDTEPYRNRLTQLQSGRAALAPMAQAPAASAVTSEDLQDLTSAIQQGVVQSRAQAIQVIQAAGLDPNDPAFREVLSRLR